MALIAMDLTTQKQFRANRRGRSRIIVQMGNQKIRRTVIDIAPLGRNQIGYDLVPRTISRKTEPQKFF